MGKDRDGEEIDIAFLCEDYVLFLNNFTDKQIRFPCPEGFTYMPCNDRLYYKIMTIEELDELTEYFIDFKNKVKEK